ncbi:MAG: DUF488 family protein [Alicyclobacillus sp.]|nr:DUF488 family protein [Alicyclobacillus sp.]
MPQPTHTPDPAGQPRPRPPHPSQASPLPSPDDASTADSGGPHGLQLKRVYDPPGPTDGQRILVDRLWPRGLRKAAAQLDAWWPEIAPSPELRSWFAHQPERFPAFRVQYQKELQTVPAARARLQELLAMVQQSPVTLLYAARDPVYNHARVLAEVVADALARPASPAVNPGISGTTDPNRASDTQASDT